MARTVTFNARRGREPAKLMLANKEAVEDGRWKRKSDNDALKDPIERKLASRLQLCYVNGKKKRGGTKAIVPILFTDEVSRSIRYIIKYRKVLGIHSSNEYLFAAGDFYLKGWDKLQIITKKIQNLEKPQLITLTRTTKFLATVLQLLDMSDVELTWLGHTKYVHFAWYRREDSTVELTKVARVLMAVDEGKNIKNKKTDDALKEDESAKVCRNEIDNSNTVENEMEDDGVMGNTDEGEPYDESPQKYLVVLRGDLIREDLTRGDLMHVMKILFVTFVCITFA